VTNNVTEAGRYGGYPLQPIKEALKTAVNVGHLNRMRKDLNSVMKHLRLDAKTLDEKSIEDGCLVVKDSVECAAGGNGIDAKKDGET
jgi:hypothetical protein